MAGIVTRSEAQAAGEALGILAPATASRHVGPLRLRQSAHMSGTL